MGNVLMSSQFGSFIPTPNDIGAATKEDLDNYLPITGGTATGNLEIEKTTPTFWLNNTSADYLNDAFIQLYANSLSFGIRNDANNDNNKRTFYISNSEVQPNVNSALRLRDTVDGTATYYNIYGTHNITKGTTDLTAGTSALSTGAIYLVYE